MPPTGFQRTLSTLARTPNQSAAGVLLAAIEGPSAAVRNGGLGALAKRRDELSQRTMLGVFPELTTPEITALKDAPRQLRTTLRKLIAEHDPQSARLACHFVLTCGAFDEFPPLVAAACDPQHPAADVFASTVLDLARALHAELVAYRRAPSGRDPSFARRWALTALTKAVEMFRDHRRREMLEAFLLITTPGNPLLTQLLTDSQHPGHEPLLAMLRTSPSVGAIEVLAKLLDDETTPLAILEVAAQRTDDHFRTTFLEAVGFPASPRTLANAGRVKKWELLENPTDQWYRMPPTAQAVAVQLVAASRFSRRTKLAIFDALLDAAAPLARMTVCDALGHLELPEAAERLERLLADADPHVVATASKALRRHGNADAVGSLADLLDHSDQAVRELARTGLKDFTFLRFLGQFDTLDEAKRSQFGRIVAETDPSATDQLRRELGAATLSRKLRALQMAAATGMVDALLDVVLKQAGHQDAAVRAEALQALGSATSDRAREALERAADDSNALVRKRAAQALKVWASKAATGGGGQ